MASRSSRSNRFAWAAIALVALVLFGFNIISEWSGPGGIDWPVAVGRIGFLVLAGTNVADPPSARLRQTLTYVSAVLILAGLVFQVRRHL